MYDIFFVFITPFFTKVRPVLSWLFLSDFSANEPFEAFLVAFKCFTVSFSAAHIEK